jgi:hypothetical protein
MADISVLRQAGQLAVGAALFLSALALAGCGGAAMNSAAVQPTPAASPTVVASLPARGPTPTGQSGATPYSSLTNQGAGTPEMVRSTSIASLRLVPTADGRALELRVDDVRDLYAVDVEIKFDPARLQVADADAKAQGVQILPGRAPAPEFVAINSADNQKGAIRYVATQLGDRAAFSGSGVVATINWQSGADPNATISVESATLVNGDLQPIESAVKP